MIELLYSFVGERRIASVQCNATCTVEDVRDAIALHEQPLACPPRSWRLYLTKRNTTGAWLRECDHDLRQLMRPRVAMDLERAYLQFARELHVFAPLDMYFPNGLQGIPHDVIHLLVDARPNEDVLEARAMATATPAQLTRNNGEDVGDDLKWVSEHGAYPQLTFKPLDPLLHIPRAYLVNSGVVSPHPKGDLVLYRRAAFQDQWSMIQYNALDSYAQHWIIGAPGTGKSCAAYAFACGQVDRTRYDVVWLHFSSYRDSIQGVKFQDDCK